MDAGSATTTLLGEHALAADDASRVDPAARHRQASLRKDHLRDIRRARIVGVLGAACWPFFVLYDVLQTRWVQDGDLPVLIGLRIAGELILIASVTMLYRTPPLTEAGFRRLVTATVFGISTTLALMCVCTDGLTSIYVAGNMLAGVAVVFAPQPFAQAMRTIFVSLSAHPLVLGIATAFVPRIREQLGDPHVVGRALQYLFCAVTIGTAIAGLSHVFHGLRQQIYESGGIGRYRLHRLLGKGGSSEVWAAYHLGLEREVALKLLEPWLQHDARARRSFSREVRATASLTHPNTVRIFDHGVTEDGVLFYAMELLDGLNVAEVVRREGPLAPARAIHLARQAARSLAEAHRRGIVHRDVKPENLLVCEAGLERDFVKVLDFGIATNVADGGTEASEAVIGSPVTMSPEMIQRGQATPASDIYGMGVVLYHLLTGSYPFAGGTVAETLAAHLHSPPPPPGLRAPGGLPAELEALVLRCLAKSPADRPRDGAALDAELAPLAARFPWTGEVSPSASVVAAPSAPPPTADDVRTIRPGRTR